MNKISKLIRIARAIHNAKNSVFASKDLLELLKDPAMRKKLEEKQKQEEQETKKEKSEKKPESKPSTSKSDRDEKMMFVEFSKGIHPTIEKKRIKAPKAKEDRTLEEDLEQEEKQLEKWISKQAFQRGLLILKEEEDAQDIAYLNRIMDEIESQALPKQDEPYADKIRFGISFVRSLRGKTSKTAAPIKFTGDFSDEELQEMKKSLDEQEVEEAEKRSKFLEEYGVELPEGRSWERTLKDGTKIYVLSSKQLATLTTIYMFMRKRLQGIRARQEQLKEKAKKLLFKLPSSESKKPEMDIGLEDDLDDVNMDFFKK